MRSNTHTAVTGTNSPRIDVTMNCEPDLAVMSARFSPLAKALCIAARDALEDRKQMFLPA
eukprot:3869-Eustigmatos_ZCMA.PRE.1